MQTRSDSIGTSHSTVDSAAVLRRQDERATDTVQSYENGLSISKFHVALYSVESALNSFADIAVVLAVIPLLMFTGPSQADTVSGAAIPLIIMAACPLLSWIATRSTASTGWLAINGFMRLALAVVLLKSPEFPFLSGGFLTLLLALSIATRLQSSVIMAPIQSRSEVLNFICFALPAAVLLALLKFYNEVQPLLLSSAIGIYTLTIVIAIARLRIRNGTNSDTAMRAGLFKLSLDTMPGLTAYEIALACIAGMIGAVPTVLSLTDQSAILPALRTDVQFSLTGWIAGCLVVGLLPKGTPNSERWNEKKSQRQFRLEYLHLLFTLLLGALSFCKSSTIACALLFLTSAIAAAVSLRIVSSYSNSNRPTWQPGLTMSAIVVASAFAYIDLSPRLCALQPIHVDRTLAAICFVPSLIALFFWRGSRKMILNLVAYLVPVHNPLNQTFSFYVTKNIELAKAIMIGWRLNATIIILTEQVFAGPFVKGALQSGNIYALSINDWERLKDQTMARMDDGERFLVCNFSGSALGNISPLPAKSIIGLVETISDPDRIVISDTVLASNTSLSGSAG